MKNYLIDTHVFLWYMDGSDQLSQFAKTEIDNADKIFLSIISFWEIAIKQNVGKLELIYSLEEYSKKWKINKGLNLNLIEKHIFIYKTLPLYHRDPFDRMLIAQAITENIPIISVDTKFDLYADIQRVW